MRLLEPACLLDAWDDGEHLSPARRALLLLGAMNGASGLRNSEGSRVDDEDAAYWPLGLVNARLLALRVGLFGETLTCLADCTRCGAVVESDVPIDTLLAMDRSRADAASRDLPNARRMIDLNGTPVAVRAPCIGDLLALSERKGAQDSIDAPGAALLARLVRLAEPQSSSSGNGDDAWSAVLSGDARRQIEQCVAELDPLGFIELSLACPECGHPWQEPLHVVDLVWAEIDALASRLLREVAQLAHSFGWSERDILHMPPMRRRRYLELLAS